jgi:hypothetical protein
MLSEPNLVLTKFKSHLYQDACNTKIAFHNWTWLIGQAKYNFTG